MEPTMETYSRIIAEQPACEDPFFSDTLARYRTGDEAAARILCGSCLRLALRRAEEQAKASPNVPLSDLIQEANAGLMEAITTFTGEDRQAFLRYAEKHIEQRLAVLA